VLHERRQCLHQAVDELAAQPALGHSSSAPRSSNSLITGKCAYIDGPT